MQMKTSFHQRKPRIWSRSKRSIKLVAKFLRRVSRVEKKCPFHMSKCFPKCNKRCKYPDYIPKTKTKKKKFNRREVSGVYSS